jgi:CubicO group peptidase (beta-lactamase class C family)
MDKNCNCKNKCDVNCEAQIKILKKQISDLQIQVGYGQKISPNINSRIQPALNEYAFSHKGAFILGGNVKSEQDYFASVGSSSINDTEFTKDSIYWWASCSKILTGLVLVKMIEESLITPDVKLSKINNVFRGKGTYYTSIKVIDEKTFPFNEQSYISTIDTFNWEDVTLTDLIHMGIGLINDFIVCGALYFITFNDNSGLKKSVLEDGSVQALGSYIQAAKFFLNMINGKPIGVSTRLYYGEEYQNILLNYLEKIIEANIKGELPLFSKPGSYVKNILPYETRGIPNGYDYSYLFLGSVLDPVLKKNSYRNYADYARKKFFIPLDMNDSWIFPQESVPFNKINNIVGTSWRRSPILGLTDKFDINDQSTWAGYGCDPEYRNLSGNIPSGLLVWSNDKLFESDGISNFFKPLYTNKSFPELQALTNAPLLSSITDYGKLIKMVCNRGFYNNKQIIKTESWNYLIGIKIPITSSSLNPFPYPFNRDNLISSGWALGFGRINRDLSNETIYGFDETTCWWGGLSGCSFMFDYYTGNYLYYGMPESTLSSGTLNIPIIGSPNYSNKITSKFLIIQIN